MNEATNWQADEEPGGDRLSAFAALASGVIVVREGRISWANDRFAEMAGRGSPITLVDAPLADLLTDTGSGIIDPDNSKAVECALARPDGETRTVICRVAEPEADSDSESTWVVEDVTHVRALERELLRMSQELHRANREIADSSERLRRERDEREEFLTVVSHELRTPVTIIGGYNRLLLSEQIGPLTEQQRRFLAESSKGCQRLNTFIGNLLEAFRPSMDGEVLEITHQKLSPVVEGVVEHLEPLLEDGGLSLDWSIAPGADQARFDRMRVEQILTNLIANAIKFSPHGGVIEIRSRPLRAGPDGRSYLEIQVSDNGPGVASENRERIFEPYVQLGEESRAGGLGLGLAICKRLVEAHGGSISLAGRDEGGCVFSFTLPVGEDELEMQDSGGS